MIPMKQVHEKMERAGFASSDAHQMPDSPLRFADGAHFRHEASGISSAKLLEQLFEEVDRRGMALHRVIFGLDGCLDRQPLSALREIAAAAQQGGIELIMEHGVNSKYDIGRHVSTDGGMLSGTPCRGMDQMAKLVMQVERAAAVGIRGILLRDMGALLLLSEMRQRGDLPRDMIFKMSYTLGCSNPATAEAMVRLGADSINPITDLTCPMLSAIRHQVKVPLDLVVFGWPSLGSIKRHGEAHEMIRVAAPVYLKQELWKDPHQQAINMELIHEVIDSSGYDLKCSKGAPEDLKIPSAT